MNGPSLIERYYLINKAVSTFLEARGINTPLYKYGIDVATLKAETLGQVKRYPYFQSYLLNPRPQPWTTQGGGVYTQFEYQLSFFTGPRNEFENDAALVKEYETARLVFTDIDSQALKIIVDGKETTAADVLNVDGSYDFNIVSGAVVPKGIILVKMAAVTGYPVTLPEVGNATDIENAITISQS